MGCEHELEKLREQPSSLAKYTFLRDLQRANARLFFQLLLRHTEELMPLVYTPTVGEACQRYSHLPGLAVRGLFLRSSEAGSFLARLRSWPQQDIRVVVVTDGERVLGLGDLGAGGMGISEGKILLYTAAAGVPPEQCLPVCLDVGTNNEALLQDPSYIGLRQRRLVGAAYDDVVAEFMDALHTWQPHVLIQFEDFANHNAFRVLQRYRPTTCCFNDDIQGTACIALAGLLSALRATGSSLAQQRVLFYGAGEAGTGIAELIAIALQQRHGLTLQQGRQCCFFLDSKGAVCASRADLQPHKRPFAHDWPHHRSLLAAVTALRPTALIGVSSQPGAFSAQVLQAMADANRRPIIMPLSNPTSQAECTFQEALTATGGRLLFASGSPFSPLHWQGVQRHATQSNNAYVFPAVGFAAVLARASVISDDIFLTAAECLSHLTTLKELEEGLLFPRFRHILDVSATLTAQVAERMCAEGSGTEPPQVTQLRQRLRQGVQPGGCSAWELYVRSQMYSATEARL